MTSDKTAANGHEPHTGGVRVKRGLAEMLKGGVIMDVVTAEQAKIAEDAGAVAVMALERVPSDIRRDGGVARMSDVSLIKEIIAAVTIPVMAKARIGHFVEAQVLQSLGVDYIDESEVLTPADEEHHIDKWQFDVPVRVRRARPRRGAATHRRRRGDDPHQGRGRNRQRGRGGPPHARGAGRHPPHRVDASGGADGRGQTSRRAVRSHPGDSQDGQASGRQLLRRWHRDSRRRRADDAAWVRRQLRRAAASSRAPTPRHTRRQSSPRRRIYDKPEVIAEVSAGLGKAMPGLDVASMPAGELLATRGW